MVKTDLDTKSPIIGIWDGISAPLSLGGLLIFIAELQIQRHAFKVASESTLCVISRENPLSKESVFLPLFEGLEGIKEILWKESLDALLESSTISRRLTWPDIWDRSTFPHFYESTLVVQKFFEQNHFIPHLSCRKPTLEWADKFLKRHVKKGKIIAVHLKNKPQEEGQSNAHLPSWEKFFTRCQDQYPVKFILVGNEKIPATIKRLDNVVVTQDLKSNLLRDLALIQQADAFMGMASGPGNMAMLNTKPYVIFKNPKHHTEEMQEQLGDGEKFNFSSPVQKFLRVKENEQRLLAEFEEIYKRLEGPSKKSK